MDILINVFVFIAGFFSGIAVKVTIDRRKTRIQKTTTKQMANIVGGDQAGRDIIKHD